MAVDPLGPASLNAVTTRPARSIVRGTVATWLKDCTDPALKDGTFLGADFFNDMLAQFRTLFTGAGIAVDNADDMLLRAVQSYGIRYAEDSSGTANVIVAAFAPPVLSLYNGLPFLIKIANNVTGATTVAADATGALPLKNGDGSALSNGQLKAGQVAFVVKVGTVYQLIVAFSAPVGGSGAQPFYQATYEMSYVAGVQMAPSGLTLVSNSLSTSTYAAGTFTVGAGEGGLWAFQLGTTSEQKPVEISTFIQINAIAALAFGSSHDNAWSGGMTTAVGFARLAEGDTVSFYSSIYPISANGGGAITIARLGD
ncbi:MAG: hypothetical protein GC182_08490 [Rhodopseudomonas sp.]|nr:hypothetical protein [Rhodopseudomonas sp.]